MICARDGYANGEELEVESFPGDPKSTPTTKRRNYNLVYIMAAVSILLIAGRYLRMNGG